MNPLLEASTLKNAAVNFQNLKPEHFKTALEETIRRGRDRLKALKDKPATFENTIQGLEGATEDMEFVFSVFSNLMLAHTNDTLQALAMELGPLVASFANDILLDPEIFVKIKTVYENRDRLNLNATQFRLLEKFYLDFKRSGAELDEEKKKRLRQLDERLAQLHPTFRDNVLKATNAFELWIDKEADLEGLPASAKTAAREAAKERGQATKWLFTLQFPSYFPFMIHSARRDLREKMAKAYGARAFQDAFDNTGVLREIVDLMTEKSKLLGFKNYAEYALQLRMAETPQQVRDFLNRLLRVAKPAAEKELQEIREFARQRDGLNDLKPWDVNYYAERLKETKYAFDEEQLRPYFKLENVLKGAFTLAGKLYGLKFQPAKDYPTYHPDVQVFEVHKQGADGAFIGLLYADFFPRESKSGGAWMANYKEAGIFRGQLVRPHVTVVCNFTKPTSDQPSLLTFGEVQTLFHEFGHALHGLLSQVEYRSISGTNVYLDFVELPSQIMENWAEEAEALKLFAFHYQTGELIPMDLVDKLKRSQQFMAAYTTMRQLNFAELDLAWFDTPPQKGESVVEFEDRILAPLRLMPTVPGTNISASFAHIFGGGYAAGYYSYKWAEALDADAFELFKERGIFDSQTAQAFEHFILSKGGSDHPMRLYEQFRGRSPDPEALLRRDGLIS